VASEIKMANGQRDISNELPGLHETNLCVGSDMSRVLNYFPGNFISAKNQDAFVVQGGGFPHETRKNPTEPKKRIF